MKMITLAALASLAFTGAAMAQTPGAATPPPGGGMGGGGRFAACRDDNMKLCPDKHGPDRRACMMDNKDKLSDGCKAAMAAMKPPGQ